MAFLSWLLMWFEAISGLRINLDKSEILPVGRVENVEILALGTRLQSGSTSFHVLGDPLVCTVQICGGLGWGGGKVLEVTSHVEVAIYF